MAEFAAGGNVFRYRVTGKQSIDRLVPLITELIPCSRQLGASELNIPSSEALDFVWETTCEKELKCIHQKAIVYNKLCNSQVIESKSSFAALQLNIDYPMLETRVATNAANVAQWANKRWNGDQNWLLTSSNGNRDWWVVKASRGNGGRDIWVMNPENYQTVLAELPPADEYVIQRYANNPLLFRGKKFHFRCYTTMTANGTAHVYQKAFILSAGLDFDYADADVRKHVTNLSVNKRFVGHPGQVPCLLPQEYPEVYERIKTMWAAVVTAALPYMQHQVSQLHFEFFGIDVIADHDGQVWLIEANRLPGLESSKNNQAEEDAMYDEMMTSLLRVVLRPVVPSGAAANGTEGGLWDTVRSVAPDCASPQAGARGDLGWKNLLKWRAFTKANRQKILAEFA